MRALARKLPLVSLPSRALAHGGPELQCRIQELAWSELAELTPEWERLSLCLETPEPFFQPYWLLAFSSMVPSARTATVVTVRDRGSLEGILPLIQASNCFGGIRARTLRSLSGTHSCRFDLVCNEQSRGPITRAIWGALQAEPSWDIIEALNVPAGGSFEALQEWARNDGFLTATWPTLRMPYLDLPTQDADPFDNSPKQYRNFRRRLGTYQKRLAQEGNLTYGCQEDLTEGIFDAFLALESSGWKRRTGGAIAQSQQVRQFYLRALAGASQAGHLRIYWLRLKGKPIAMELGLVLNGRYYSPKAAYDEEFSRYSPGHLLTHFIIADLTRNGACRYDFLGPRARHKYVWTDNTRNHAHRFIIRPTMGGRMAHFALSALAPRLRQLKYACFGDPQGNPCQS